jgi:predicted RNA-binding Zn ribbon-like protein
VETIIDFVNTREQDTDYVDECLDSPAALESFLADHGFGQVSVKPADLRRAIDVREALREMMRANNGEPLRPDVVERLNRAVARAKVVAAFDDNESWRVEPAADGVDRALGTMLASVFRSMSDGSWSRVKACGNPDCGWAFYDGSKNHSGRWCDMASCGNRMKARAFRERAAAHTPTSE